VIVRPAGDRIHLITQPDHARLAHAIMAHCVPLAALPRRDAILHATAQHDNGWAEPDAEPTVDADSGTIADFVNAPVAVRHAVWPRGVARLADDPWAAALVAHPADSAYDRYRPDPAWHAFFAGLEAARDAWLRASGLPIDDLAGDYAFVRLGDLVSLAFCTGWTDEHRVGDWAVRLAGTTVTVTPDPFGGVRIPFSVDARELPNRRFTSDEELREAVRRARTTTLRGEVAGGPATR
jgi:hypothetical protein